MPGERRGGVEVGIRFRCSQIDISKSDGMTRTQIQLPDEVYERARKVC